MKTFVTTLCVKQRTFLLARRRFALVPTLAIVLGEMTAVTQGATKTWNTAGSSALWNVPGNWTASGVPATGDLLTFGAASPSGSTLTDDISGLVTGNITFSAAAPSYTMNGATNVVLGVSAAGITNNSTNAQLFNVPLTIAGLVTAGTNSMTFNGPIGDGATIGQFRAQSGTVTLSGANTYTGGTIVNSTTTLKLAGSGTLGNTSGSLSITFGGILDLNGTNQTIGNLDTAGATNGTILNNSGSGTSILTIGTGNTGGGNFGAVIKDNTVAGGKVALVKNGSNTITLSGSNTYTGNTTVNAGTLKLGGTATIRTSLTIGDGSSTAAVTYDSAGGNDKINDATAVTVNTGGTLNVSGKTDTVNSINVAGGTVDIGAGGTLTQLGAAATLQMTGGTIQNGTFAYSQLGSGVFTTNAAATTATISSALTLGGNTAPMSVADGTAVIDLDVSGVIGGNVTFTKSGTGTMRLSAPSGSTFGAGSNTNINAGTLLVTNTSGSATGQRPLLINAGATLGGTGYIGGVLAYTLADTTLTGTGTSASTVASLSPGTPDASDVSTVGTLHIGGPAQANNISFGNFSKLVVQIGNTGSNDQLAVTGGLNLNSAGASDVLQLLTLPGATPGGTYTLATFTGTLKGRFDGVTLDGVTLAGPYSLEYRNSSGTPVAGIGDITGGGSIVLAIPEPGSFALVSLAGLFMVRRRARVATR